MVVLVLTSEVVDAELKLGAISAFVKFGHIGLVIFWVW